MKMNPRFTLGVFAAAITACGGPKVEILALAEFSDIAFRAENAGPHARMDYSVWVTEEGSAGEGVSVFFEEQDGTELVSGAADKNGIYSATGGVTYPREIVFRADESVAATNLEDNTASVMGPAPHSIVVPTTHDRSQPLVVRWEAEDADGADSVEIRWRSGDAVSFKRSILGELDTGSYTIDAQYHSLGTILYVMVKRTNWHERDSTARSNFAVSYQTSAIVAYQ